MATFLVSLGSLSGWWYSIPTPLEKNESQLVFLTFPTECFFSNHQPAISIIQPSNGNVAKQPNPSKGPPNSQPFVRFGSQMQRQMNDKNDGSIWISLGIY